MKQTINEYQFERAFKNMDRGEQFSYDGLKALFEYLEDYEEDTGEEIELDVIALCCEFTEYNNLKEFQSDYGEKWKNIKEIENFTQVISIDNNSFIIQQF